ncbi:MAG TPA: cellulase family glycosylhydrolase, partial [Clostridiales bacterium]|nr:cellulase family glycosylhydrolase [Clostridiales bacterium]
MIKKRIMFIVATVLLAMPLLFGSVGNIDKIEAASSAVTDMPGGRLTGVNWFGFETSNYVVHGLWSRDYKSMLQQISDLGFNCLRIPWCNEMIGKSPNSIQINPDGVDAYTEKRGLNLDLAGLSSLEVLDKIVEEAGKLGLKIILDNHSRAAGGYMNEQLWYTGSYSEQRWINDWVMLAERYKNNVNVVGFDLNNEPHGIATWGEGDLSTNWNEAATRCGQAILKVNPNALIMIEGVEKYRGDTYWWGGNLSGVNDYPITGIPAGNLVYSPHDYGPTVFDQAWFSDPSFPNNMTGIWDEHFWFIYKNNIAPILLGEFGIKEEAASDPSSGDYKWFTTLMSYVGDKASWTFWCWNPNSGDTGGILKDDWVTVNQAKYNILKPYLAPQFGGITPPSPEEDTTSPTSPRGLKATTLSNSSIKLEWNKNSESDLAGYKVYRSTTSNFTPNNSNFIKQVTANTYTDTGLNPNTTYYYKITAVDTSGNESEPSAQVSATTLSGTEPP